jgi:hypothetical protein
MSVCVRDPGTHWIGGWVGPRAVLDTVVKRKIPSSRRESNPKNPDCPARSPALHRLSYHGSFLYLRLQQIWLDDSSSNARALQSLDAVIYVLKLSPL